MLRHSIMILLASLALAGPAPAQQPAAPVKPAAHNPDERICEDLYVGTRVNKKRYCGTRAEWEAMKQQDREEVERKQRPLQCNKPMGKNC